MIVALTPLEHEKVRLFAHTRFIGERPACELLFKDDL